MSATQLLHHIDEGRHDRALAMVLARVDDGVSVGEVVTDLLAPAQQLVGDRWHAGTYTITQEHVASATIEDALGVLATRTRPGATAGTVALVCAGGEWHTTPARMAALGLRDAGWTVDFLGGSTPVPHLAAALEHGRPSFLAVSATLPLSLTSVPAMVEAAHALDIPVLVGGRAWGPDDRRAVALGADARPTSTADADRLLRTWMDRPPVLRQPRTDAASVAEHATLTADRTGIVGRAYDALARLLPSMHHYDDRQRDHTRRDLDFSVQFLAVAVLLDDPTVLTDYLDWLTALLGYRGLDGHVVRRTLDALHEAVGPELPRARALLAAGQEATGTN